MVDVVIGSGPAGVAAASALLRCGRRVLMLDVGETMQGESVGAKRRMATAEPAHWSLNDIEVVTSTRQANRSDSIQPFGSDFLFREPGGSALSKSGDSAIPNRINQNNDSGLRSSYAIGGLSNGWGAAILPYSETDILDWPVSIADLAPHYNAIKSIMPMAAANDALAKLFTGVAVSDEVALPLSSQAHKLHKRLLDRQSVLAQQGVYVGQSRLAVNVSDCRRCGMCLYGCPYGVIFNAAHVLTTLCDDDKFEYVSGMLVQSFVENADGVSVIAIDPVSGDARDFHADRLFIAGGVLPTAALVLSSLGQSRKTVQLKDSQHFYLPMLHSWWPKPNPASESATTLAQLFVELQDPSISEHLMHFQLYGFNDLYEKDMRLRFGFLASLCSPFIRHLSRRLIVAQGFLHSDHSAKIELSLTKNPLGYGVSQKAISNPETLAVIAKSSKKFSYSMRGAGAIALNPLLRPGDIGTSFHCGGSFPMSKRPEGLQTDVLGRPVGLQRVHIVDASVFPSIPATTITLSVMANSHRIATEASNI